MGSRANYAIRTGGRVELFYSHWGAATVGEDIYWGPERTEAFIGENAKADTWLDSVWAEGGIGLDKDRRRMVYKLYEWPLEQDLRRAFEQILAETWSASGWKVEHAHSWGELAESVGVPAESVTARPIAPSLIGLDQMGLRLAQGSCYGLLAVRKEEEWRDHAIDCDLAGVLMNGPGLLEALDRVAGLADMRDAFRGKTEEEKESCMRFFDFCAIDADARIVRVSLLYDFEQEAIPLLQEVWTGWTVYHDGGGVEGHFHFTGRPVPPDLILAPVTEPSAPPERPFSECVRLIEEHLLNTEQRKDDKLAWFKNALKEIGEHSGPLTVSEAALARVELRHRFRRWIQ
jgi:hypothetical protein